MRAAHGMENTLIWSLWHFFGHKCQMKKIRTRCCKKVLAHIQIFCIDSSEINWQNQKHVRLKQLLSHPYSAAIQLPLRLSHERIGGKADYNEHILREVKIFGNFLLYFTLLSISQQPCMLIEGAKQTQAEQKNNKFLGHFQKLLICTVHTHKKYAKFDINHGNLVI